MGMLNDGTNVAMVDRGSLSPYIEMRRKLQETSFNQQKIQRHINDRLMDVTPQMPPKQ